MTVFKLSKHPLDDGFSTHTNSRMNFFFHIGIEDYQGDRLFMVCLVLLKRQVKFNHWINSNIPVKDFMFEFPNRFKQTTSN